MEIPAYHQLPLVTNASIHPCWLPAGVARSSASSGISQDPLELCLDVGVTVLCRVSSPQPGDGHCSSCSPNSMGKVQTHPQTESKPLWGGGSPRPGQGTLLKPTAGWLKSQGGTGWTGQCHVPSLATISRPCASFPVCFLHLPALQAVCDVEQGFLVVPHTSLPLHQRFLPLMCSTAMPGMQEAELGTQGRGCVSPALSLCSFPALCTAFPSFWRGFWGVGRRCRQHRQRGPSHRLCRC